MHAGSQSAELRLEAAARGSHTPPCTPHSCSRRRCGALLAVRRLLARRGRRRCCGGAPPSCGTRCTLVLWATTSAPGGAAPACARAARRLTTPAPNTRARRACARVGTSSCACHDGSLLDVRVGVRRARCDTCARCGCRRCPPRSPPRASRWRVKARGRLRYPLPAQHSLTRGLGVVVVRPAGGHLGPSYHVVATQSSRTLLAGSVRVPAARRRWTWMLAARRACQRALARQALN
jgi:hypothetical protein